MLLSLCLCFPRCDNVGTTNEFHRISHIFSLHIIIPFITLVRLLPAFLYIQFLLLSLPHGGTRRPSWLRRSITRRRCQRWRREAHPPHSSPLFCLCLLHWFHSSIFHDWFRLDLRLFLYSFCPLRPGSCEPETVVLLVVRRTPLDRSSPSHS